MYVDDGMSGDTRARVQEMVGECHVSEDGKLTYDGLVSRVLSEGGFRVKTFVTSGNDNPPEAIAKLGPVLGHEWRPESDRLYFSHVNQIKLKQRGREVFLTKEMVDNLQYTQRLALAVVSQSFDPLGLICPLFIRMKISMRTIVSLGLGWDVHLPPPLQTVWRNFTKDLLDFPEVSFPRSVVPEDAVGRPELVGFFDASDQAYAACIFVRWRTRSGGWFVSLLCAKARVCPTSGLTTPRAELNALLILVRLIEVAVLALAVQPCRITLAGDSTCSISSMEAKASVLAS